MKHFNIIRYCLAIILPFVLSCLFSYALFPIYVLIFLFINNLIDDLVFYHGSKYVEECFDINSLLSPVEGVVTKIEYHVPLFNHLCKCDVLTKDELISNGIDVSQGDYTHITIFLNKFNKHLVARIGKLEKMTQYSLNGENVEMVNEGELISDNSGRYLVNTFVDFEYEWNIHVVVTMDKYISKAVVPQINDMVEMLICRGSQCDIYVPSKDSFILTNEKKQVNVLEPIVRLNNMHKCIRHDKYKIKNIIEECIAVSGFTVVSAIKSNLAKTLDTFKHNYILLVICLLAALFYPISVTIGVYLYLFMLDRSVKNLMYSIMNVIGYKSWMTYLYRYIHNITTWKIKN